MLLSYEEAIQNGIVKRIVRAFNSHTNTRHSFSGSSGEAAYKMYVMAEGDEDKVLTFILRNSFSESKNGNMLIPAVNKFRTYLNESSKEETPAQPIATNNVDGTMTMLANIVTNILAETKSDEIRDKVIEMARDSIASFIKENYGTIQRKTEIITPTNKVVVNGITHSVFDEVLTFISNKDSVYLYGPAGAGKNVICMQVAEALGIPFYMSNAVTQEYKITGYSDAMGNYVESSFYKAFKNGGLFMLDEMDASSPEALVVLNAALANGYFDFPAPIGMVYAHPNFRCIGAGNTNGIGATNEYNARNQLDFATLDRFMPIYVDYDTEIEKQCADGDMDLVYFVHNLRNGARECGLSFVISYRGITKTAAYKDVLPDDKVLSASILKTLGLDDMMALSKYISGNDRYSTAFNKVLNNLKAMIK